MTVPVVVATGAVIRRGRHLLLVQRKQPPEAGRWSLPGGRVEPGETLRRAVRREVGEELALDATIGELIGVVERRGPEYHYVIADFHATVDANATPVAGDDAAACEWVLLNQLDSWDLVEGLSEFLTDVGIC